MSERNYCCLHLFPRSTFPCETHSSFGTTRRTSCWLDNKRKGSCSELLGTEDEETRLVVVVVVRSVGFELRSRVLPPWSEKCWCERRCHVVREHMYVRRVSDANIQPRIWRTLLTLYYSFPLFGNRFQKDRFLNQVKSGCLQEVAGKLPHLEHGGWTLVAVSRRRKMAVI